MIFIQTQLTQPTHFNLRKKCHTLPLIYNFEVIEVGLL